MSFLHSTRFPPYVLDSLDENLVVLAGGGGTSKTGVPNSIELIELNFASTQVSSKSVHIFEMDDAIMRGKVVSSGSEYRFIAVLNNRVDIYRIRCPEEGKPAADATKPGLTRRKKLVPIEILKSIPFNMKLTKDKEDYLNCVDVHAGLGLAVVGQCSGLVHLIEKEKIVSSFDSKMEELDDISVHPGGKHVALFSRKTGGTVWQIDGDGKLVTQLVLKSETSKNYQFRRGCYVSQVDKQDVVWLITTHNPRVRGGKTPSFIVKWNDKDYQVQRSTSHGKMPITTLQPSKDGVFLAVGDANGDISIYITFSLQRTRRIHAHANVVTALSFLPPAIGPGRDFECACASASIDQKIQLVTLQHRRKVPFWIVLTSTVILIYVIFALMATIAI